jgi:hypothetical protein
MGGSGKALPGGGKRHKANSPFAQAKDGGYGLPPHPVAVRPGQRYFPRSGSRRRQLQVTKVQAPAGVALARQLDGGRRTVRLTLGRLLAVGDDGQGLHYQFAGHAQRRYATHALVIKRDASSKMITLALPEWHPGRPVRIAQRLVPPDSQMPGSWLACTADLSQARAAALNLADLTAASDPPEWLPAPTYAVPDELSPPSRPACGRGCGDIVVELAGRLEGHPQRGGLFDLFVSERPIGLHAGDRVYLACDGIVRAYLELAALELRPNGALLRCQPEPRRMAHSLRAGARNEGGHWIWRWWTRHAEEVGGDLLAREAAAYDLEEHAPDYCWTWRQPPSSRPVAT